MNPDESRTSHVPTNPLNRERVLHVLEKLFEAWDMTRPEKMQIPVRDIELWKVKGGLDHTQLTEALRLLRNEGVIEGFQMMQDFM